jgi:hypothetical protein
VNAVGKIVVKNEKRDETFSVACHSQAMEPDEIPGIDQGSNIILGAKTQCGINKAQDENGKDKDADWINTLEFLMLKENMIYAELTKFNLDEDINNWNAQAKDTAPASFNTRQPSC